MQFAASRDSSAAMVTGDWLGWKTSCGVPTHKRPLDRRQSMDDITPNIAIPVDLMNPGQFFACCGLLELADRKWPHVEGWFSCGSFSITSSETACSLAALLRALDEEEVEQLDPEDNAASALRLTVGLPMLLNW